MSDRGRFEARVELLARGVLDPMVSPAAGRWRGLRRQVAAARTGQGPPVAHRETGGDA